MANSLQTYIENLPLVQSDYYTPFWSATLDHEQTLELVQKIIDNCYLETNDNYPINNTDNIYYTWQNKKYSLPVGDITYNGVCFYLEYSTGHMRVNLSLAIPISQFRSMLIYKAIDYDKPIGE